MLGSAVLCFPFSPSSFLSSHGAPNVSKTPAPQRDHGCCGGGEKKTMVQSPSIHQALQHSWLGHRALHTMTWQGGQASAGNRSQPWRRGSALCRSMGRLPRAVAHAHASLLGTAQGSVCQMSLEYSACMHAATHARTHICIKTQLHAAAGPSVPLCAHIAAGGGVCAISVLLTKHRVAVQRA